LIEELDMALERLQQKFGDAIFDVWFGQYYESYNAPKLQLGARCVNCKVI
jgi:hypothetical protein